MAEDKTHFGYREVGRAEKATLVNHVFSSVAERYDLMNDVMSLGIHRAWKRYAAWLCAVRPQHRVLDLAGGTGDMTLHLHRRLDERGEIVVADVNAGMLELARARLLDRGLYKQISFVCCDAESLPFAKDIFDRVVIAFGLRNMVDKQRALQSVHRAIKPGGRLVILEFSRPRRWIQPLYDAWSFGVIPFLGRRVAGDETSYRYLVESIRMHPGQEALLAMMNRSGFKKCRYRNLSQGIVAVHHGYKL